MDLALSIAFFFLAVLSMFTLLTFGGVFLFLFFPWLVCCFGSAYFFVEFITRDS